MALSYKAVIQSKTTRFVVGSGKAIFHVHQGILNHYGLFLEERDDTNCVRLSNVYADTFSRFIEFLYTGDYATAEPDVAVIEIPDDEAVVSIDDETPPSSHGDEVPECEEVASEPHLGEEPVLQPGLFWDSFGMSAKKKKKQQKKSCRNDEFGIFMDESIEPIPEPVPEPKPTRFSPFKMSKTKPDPWQEFLEMSCGKQPPLEKLHMSAEQNRTSPHLDYSPVFLCHARLHTLAEHYDLEALQKLSLHKLHQILVNFEPIRERASDIGALLQYAYCNEASDDDHQAENKTELQKLVICYVCCKIDQIKEDETFKSVVSGRNNASWDLLEKMMKRLS
ncbi:hypothetical protein AC579_8851 [Pseudocercospora musae]|uniref:BTB domain-containing protein n=1 Tax=Pseudocercospora musae TaxID=113226 RepID=A0A139IHA4_9PEZI|nr:hypothetical protein AC579_8851 [Pseudocercospora musae]